jgi:RinA family phage transcriptional activator
MADRIDSILRDYFSGRLDLKIKQREYEIRHDTGPVDENIGGGRAQNKQARPLDDMMIRLESDKKLQMLIKQKEDVKRWIATFEPDKQKVVAYYYASKSVTWVKVAQQFHIGESTAKSWRVEVKHILGAVL